MSDEKPMGQVIQIDEARIRDHLGEMVRGTVEETLCPSSDDLRLVRRFAKRGSGSSGVRLGGLQPVLQATVCNSGTLNALAFGEDCLSSPEVDIGRSEVVEALVIADVVIVRDEGVDLPFKITRQIVVVE